MSDAILKMLEMFTNNDLPVHSSIEFISEREESDFFMPDIQLTHTGVFHLERLEDLIYDRYQKEFDIEDEESLRELVSFASRLQDQEIQREFLLFYLNCGSDTQMSLKSSDAIDKTNYIQQN